MENKICSKCKQNLPFSEFPKNKSKKDGYGHYCLECQRKYIRNHYKDNMVYYKEKAKRRSVEGRQWFNELKRTLKCNRCNEAHWSCLEFHHQDPTRKDIAISTAVNIGWGQGRILREMDKCEVLCSNCHRKHHFP